MIRILCLEIAAVSTIWFGAAARPIEPGGAGTWKAPIPVQTPAPPADPTPLPDPTATPGPEPTAGPSVFTQIFKVVFSAETLSEAIAEALESAAEQEAGGIEAQTTQASALIAEILQPPAQGNFAAVASASLSTAAALAPALFLVRLVLFHWNRLLNEDDTLLRVFGDWLAAGFLAVSAGPFLDLVVQAGWWMAAAALGETRQLAAQFIAITSVSDTVLNLTVAGRPSMLAALFWIAGGLGGLVGVVGLAAAFAVAQAVLFVLGTIAPVLAVLAVVPQMRWLRGLWLKAVAVLGLLPVAAGGIFKAGVILSSLFGGGGLSELLIRLFWLWGAVGFMLSLAGILGRVTLSTAVESTARIGKGIRDVVATAAGAAVKSPAGAAAGAGAAASDRLAAAPASAASDLFSGGLQAPLYVRGRSEVFGPSSRPDRSPGEESGTDRLVPYFSAAGLDLQEFQARYPEEVSAIAAVFDERPGAIAESPEPLAEAARLAGADQISERLGGGGSG